MYLRCPHCGAEQRVKVAIDLDRLTVDPGISERCTVCETEVPVSEATTYRRP